MIKEVVTEKLPIHSQKESEKNLGNREMYIGASDIVGCPRKAILSKFAPVDHSPETLIKFLRGHIAESVVENALKETKYLWATQYEVTHKELPFIKAHLDFIIYSRDYKKIFVVEVKSVNGLPDSPYGNWQNQLYFQMGLLKDKFPEAIVKGSIFAVDVNTGKYKEYNSFEYNEVIYKMLIEKAKEIWNSLNKLKETGAEEGLATEVSPLCAYCQFKQSCPNFTGDELSLPDEIKDEIVKFAELQEQEKEIKEQKEKIRDFVMNYLGGDNKYKFAFDGLKLEVYQMVSKRIDTNILKTDFQEIYNACLKENASIMFKVS
ncbi:hypothetical protein DESAMIL20_698 [Desulfurella amilsii]|uniref:Uncharacterized protein n=1 Tax=Desulfurella amilsii TaxID=1562698 RepID=A0A1X4XYD1_9BACT|nr:NERD domain-containing protein [Desulfurella amilsii]OSS42514.1 hypothetical protein DESAMIL20_698 [Desulfurella amilsii]